MFNGKDDRSNIKGNKRSGHLTLLTMEFVVASPRKYRVHIHMNAK